ncbi:penicillin-binding protein 2 [Leptolyngbya sp. DQ-M1]|uniref:peptidoglycan D,D-transpeptidase FtsI family protein n=1 Tax=Leptolyngbya sp. DQ-M1 TaxID=2933920 RepID=UPI0032968AC0
MPNRGKPTSSPRRPSNTARFASGASLPPMIEKLRDRLLQAVSQTQLIERFRTAQAKPSVRRLFLVWAILVGATGLLSLNLVRLQVYQSPKLLKEARAQQTTFLRPFIPRRPITDRNGNVLAIDRPVYTLYAHPIAFQEPKTEIATKLSAILGIPAGDLLQRFSAGESGIRVEYAVPESAADRIQSLQIDGLELAQQQQRLYPQQTLAADVVGYLDLDRIGQAGVEYSHKNLLERSVKSVRLSRTGSGVMMPDRLPGGFLQMDNLHLQLSIDSRVQRAAIAALQPQLKKFNAKRGVVIAMDAKTGEIRTLASAPSYDPNEFYKANIEQFKNWALTDLYEPGSTFKPLNVAIALEAGAIKPDQVINDEGAIQVDGWPIQNFDFSSAGARGPSTITQIMEHSSNVGMVRIVQQMSRSTYYSWLQKIGLGQPTGSDLPFEGTGQIKDKKAFTESAIDAATSSFGQGFSITALQLVQLHGILASGGKLLTPHVVQGLFDEKGQPYWNANAPQPKPVFSPQTAQTVLKMMESVVQDGTGKAAQIPNYRIGGKTGTAQKAGETGGYIEGAKITSFVSIFPIDAPRYVVAAVIDEPKGADAFGSTVAAPIVKAVMEALIVADKIPPSVPAAPNPAASPSPSPTP